MHYSISYSVPCNYSDTSVNEQGRVISMPQHCWHLRADSAPFGPCSTEIYVCCRCGTAGYAYHGPHVPSIPMPFHGDL